MCGCIGWCWLVVFVDCYVVEVVWYFGGVGVCIGGGVVGYDYLL